MIKRFAQYLSDAVLRPRAELTRRQRQVRHAWELVAHCWRVLRRHRAEGMAAELTYRTIFSLIPLVVLGLITFRVFGGLNEIESRVEEQMYSFFGVPDIPDVAYRDDSESDDSQSDDSQSDTSESPYERTDESQPADGNLPESGDLDKLESVVKSITSDTGYDAAPQPNNVRLSPDTDRRQVQASIRWALHELTEKVAHIDFASIGVVGLLLFIYAAIALSDSVENVFNLIFEAPSERPIHLRIAIHWSIITLGSGLLAISLYTSGRLVDYVGTTTGLSITNYMNHVLALISSWVLLFLLYALMPNTTVSVRAAAIGSLVAAALWEFAKFGFQIYVSKAVPYSALYGSLGLIPLFLFWIYVTWFIFLFGLVWTYTLQSAPGRVPSKEEDDNIAELLLADPDWMILLMVEVASAFERGETVRRDDVGSHISLPNRVVHPMLDALTEHALLRRIDDEQGNHYVLARPAEKIMVDQIVEAGRYESSSKNPAWQMLRNFRQRQHAQHSGMTLAQFQSAN
jgi:membrane protein